MVSGVPFSVEIGVIICKVEVSPCGVSDREDLVLTIGITASSLLATESLR